MADEVTTPEVGSLERRRDVDNDAKFYLRQLALAEKEERDWRDRADSVLERYRDEKRRDGMRINIFWANVEILKSAVFSQLPNPDVRRRHRTQDPVAREASEMLERALAFNLDDHPFAETIEAVRDDALLVGRGVAREVYTVEIDRRDDIETVQLEVPMVGPDGAEMFEIHMLDGEPVEPDFDKDGNPFVEQIADERVETRYVYWKDFRMSPARNWPDVWWVAFRHTFTRDELIEEFGAAVGNAVELNVTDQRHEDEDPATLFRQAEVWELWDKKARKRVWVSEGLKDKLLRKDDDPLGVEGFFPMQEPLYAIQTTDTMVPIPEFCVYQDQAIELDMLAGRIAPLVDMIKAVAVFDGELGEMPAIKDAIDGDLIPSRRPGTASTGGIASMIWWWPIGEISQVVNQLSIRAEQLKMQIFEITGISDIVRGSTKASETATAQQLKGSFGDLRLSTRRERMQRFIRDGLRIKAEVMAELFDPQTLDLMNGEPVDGSVVELLRREKVRNTRIDVETDSTVRPDVEQEKADAVEYVQAVTGFLQGAMAIAMQMPQATPFLLEVLRGSSRRFKFGRRFEDELENLVQTLKEQPPEAPQEEEPQGDQAAMIKAQVDMQKAQLDAETKLTLAQLQDRTKLLELLVNAEDAEADRAAQLLQQQQRVMPSGGVQ